MEDEYVTRGKRFCPFWNRRSRTAKRWRTRSGTSRSGCSLKRRDYASSDIRKNVVFDVTLGAETVQSSVDFVVSLDNRNAMVIKCAPGSLDSPGAPRHRGRARVRRSSCSRGRCHGPHERGGARHGDRQSHGRGVRRDPDERAIRRAAFGNGNPGPLPRRNWSARSGCSWPSMRYAAASRKEGKAAWRSEGRE